MDTGFQPKYAHTYLLVVGLWNVEVFKNLLCLIQFFISLHLFVKSILKEFTSYKATQVLEMLATDPYIVICYLTTFGGWLYLSVAFFPCQ
jgi:hypothetical protein